MFKGITATANGFYGPQGRTLRLNTRVPDMNEFLKRFEYKNHKILNFEMETSALYGLSALLGHNSCTVRLGTHLQNIYIFDAAAKTDAGSYFARAQE